MGGRRGLVIDEVAALRGSQSVQSWVRPEADPPRAFVGASTPELLPTSPASLHARCSLGMMHTFQFIGSVGGAGAPKSFCEGGHAALRVVNAGGEAS